MNRETIVLTGSAGSLPGIRQALAGVPATIVEQPLLSFGPPEDLSAVDQALARFGTYRALAFTSPRAACSIIDRAAVLKLTLTTKPPDVWAVGPATASALGDALGQVRQPRTGGGDGVGAAALARAMLDAGVRSPVLFPCGESHRDELPRALRRSGIEVDEVICYRSVLASEEAARGAAAGATLLVVTSPRVVGLLTRACSPEVRPELIVVGPTTAAAAHQAGWAPTAMASEPSAGAVASAITGLLAQRW
jgi:uroporphyrinogen-III synthase